MKRRKKSHRRKGSRKHAYNGHRKHARKSHRKARRNKGRSRKVSAYARFVGAKMRSGHSMKAAARMWKKK